MLKWLDNVLHHVVRQRRLSAVFVAGALAVILLPNAASAAPITTAPKATWQTNDRVRAIGFSNGVIYLAGQFTAVRPPGTNVGDPSEVARNHAAAFDQATGSLLPWNPNLNGNVWDLEIAPGGGSVYLGGDFTTAQGMSRSHIVQVNATSGAPTSWNPSVNGRVRAISASPDGSRVYVGGQFHKVNGTGRNLVAAINTADKSLVSSFNPNVTQVAGNCPPRCPPEVASLALSPDGGILYIGGHFGAISGVIRNNAGAVNTSSGAVVAWNPNVYNDINIKNPNQYNVVYGIVVTSQRIYICGDWFRVSGEGSPNLAATFVDSGKRDPSWVGETDGGTPACWAAGGLLYTGGHFVEANGVSRKHVAAFDLTTGALDSWNPGANSDRGLHSLAGPIGASGPIAAGGDFTKIGAKFQQSFALFPLS